MRPSLPSENIRYDTGILEVYDPTQYLDFKSGKIIDIAVKDPGKLGDIRLPEYCYVGQNFAAFVTYVDENETNEYYLNRLNLKSLKVEPKIFTVKDEDIKIWCLRGRQDHFLE